MTRGPQSRKPRFRTVHEIQGRLRLKSNQLRDPHLDIEYVSALMLAQPGVKEVRINPSAACIIIRYSPDQDAHAARERFLKVLHNLPRDAWSPVPGSPGGPDRTGVAGRALAAALTPVLPRPVAAVMSWTLAAPTLLKGADTLVNEGLKVEVLDASVKLFALIQGDYFTSNTVGAMLSLADHVEHRAERKTTDLLSGLLRPQVETVRVRRNDLDVQIPFEETLVGDLVLCGPGEMSAVDGTVVEGEALVNTAAITGESVPLHVAPGDELLSGGVVEEGSLVIRAQSVGSDTSTARISGYIQRSLRNSSEKQERTEKLADRLAPITFGLGLGIFAFTGSLARAASVLTVDYSCAVKLSTPVAVRSAMYAAGKEGVLLKGARALESLASADTVIFDKTGTLTQGALEVTDIVPLDDAAGAADRLLALAAGAERHYSHPIAAAVVAAAREKGLDMPEMSQVDFIVAHGVSAYVNEKRVLAGSRHFIHDDEKVDCTAGDRKARSLQEQGKSLLYIARDGRLEGIIAMRDTLRPETASVLDGLRSLGIRRLVMLTGDQERVASALWTELPELDEVHAECKPEDKARVLEKLKAEGRNIIFVGDGVNDAPALAAADVGVSMPSGAELARDMAQVLLMKDDLTGLVHARQLALRTDQILKECLWTSVGINTALLGLASADLIPTVVSAAVHNGSTLGVLAYAGMRGAAPPRALLTAPPADWENATAHGVEDDAGDSTAGDAVK
ncbi:MAG: heavy metal translocating P-type ATPase [Desulfobacterales bacterium]|nr:MAG: heavy metal translocating P-type ATPase [Desulfobacterales bacterium]